jgi:hypothetical protein
LGSSSVKHRSETAVNFVIDDPATL